MEPRAVVCAGCGMVDKARHKSVGVVSDGARELAIYAGTSDGRRDPCVFWGEALGGKQSNQSAADEGCSDAA